LFYNLVDLIQNRRTLQINVISNIAITKITHYDARLKVDKLTTLSSIVTHIESQREKRLSSKIVEAIKKQTTIFYVVELLNV